MGDVIQQARQAHASIEDGAVSFPAWQLAVEALGAVVEAADAGHLIDTRERRDGDVIVIGPECFASADRSVICWAGVNYYAPMNAAEALAAAEREAAG
jgi:hypothetical protein